MQMSKNVNNDVSKDPPIVSQETKQRTNVCVQST